MIRGIERYVEKCQDYPRADALHSLNNEEFFRPGSVELLRTDADGRTAWYRVLDGFVVRYHPPEKGSTSTPIETLYDETADEGARRVRLVIGALIFFGLCGVDLLACMMKRTADHKKVNGPSQ